MALATLDMVPFQIKLVTFLSNSSSVFSQPGMSPAWYQMMDRHMVSATMALSTGDEDSLVSHMSSWDWTLAILSEININININIDLLIFVQSTPISIQRHPSNGFRAHSIWQIATPTTLSPK